MNKTKLEKFEKMLSIISADFDRRVLDDPEFAADMPPRAYVLFQLKIQGLSGSNAEEVGEFNAWLKDLAKRQREPGQPLYLATLNVFKSVPPSVDWHLLDRYPRDFRLVSAGGRT